MCIRDRPSAAALPSAIARRPPGGGWPSGCWRKCCVPACAPNTTCYSAGFSACGRPPSGVMPLGSWRGSRVSACNPA
eukprot:3438224-Lingulodinium_polyedra.AAC.1